MATKPMKPRNRQAMNPLMRKGGIHIKSKSAKRSQDKATLKKELRVPDLSSFLLAITYYAK
ncbi:MAG: hypothetical protein ACJA2E_002297 [Arenicella sp.]|jgi:hypothetical protein